MRRRPPIRPTKPVKLPPTLRTFLPKLDRGQQFDLGMAHIQNLDAIQRGEGTEEILWQWAGGILTWSRVAEGLQRGVDEMAAQINVAGAVIERWRRTGQVSFTGDEYLLARDGVDVMDQLAALVDRPTAVAAADWSEAYLNGMRAQQQQQAAA